MAGVELKNVGGLNLFAFHIVSIFFCRNFYARLRNERSQRKRKRKRKNKCTKKSFVTSTLFKWRIGFSHFLEFSKNGAQIEFRNCDTFSGAIVFAFVEPSRCDLKREAKVFFAKDIFVSIWKVAYIGDN